MTKNILNYGASYIAMGFNVIPLKPGDKKPSIKWADANIKAEQLSDFFKANSNIGIKLGETSGGLVDIDCDQRPAAIMARLLFKELPRFGRQSAPESHYMVICQDAKRKELFELTEAQGKIVGLLPDEKRVVMEVRGNAHYTMVPPSVHPSGESVEWVGGAPSAIPTMVWAEVVKRAGICAFLSVVLRCYPTSSGNRDEVCLALAGTLLKAGLTLDEVDEIITYIAGQKGDEEATKRNKAQATQARIDAGEPVAGLTKLCTGLGISEVQDLMHKWLYGKTPPKPHTLPPITGGDNVVTELEKMNEKFFVVEDEGGACVVAWIEYEDFGAQPRAVLRTQSFANFKARYLHRRFPVIRPSGEVVMNSLGKAWLEHAARRQYLRIVFRPGQKVPEELYNLWQGFAYEPVMGSWFRLQRHIWRVLAQRDRKAFRYIMRWAAWAVQNPDKPAEVALVFRGGKGTGKGTFCRWLAVLFGQHGMQIFSPAHLTGRFNSHLRDCILLFADEAIAPNDSTAESVLKGLLTEPLLTIEVKGRDVMQSPNHLHVVMASNAEWVAPVSADERRFAMFDVSGEMVRNKQWFDAIDAEMKNGGAAAMLYFLQNLDLKGWHPRDGVPSNKALNDQRIESLRGCDKVWFDALWTGETVGNANPNGNLIDVPTNVFAAAARVTAKKAGEYLKAMGCVQNRNVRPSCWTTPTLAEARKKWNTLKFKIGWNDAVDDWAGIPPMPQPTPEVPF